MMGYVVSAFFFGTAYGMFVGSRWTEDAQVYQFLGLLLMGVSFAICAAFYPKPTKKRGEDAA